jgi:hypothetical protein
LLLAAATALLAGFVPLGATAASAYPPTPIRVSVSVNEVPFSGSIYDAATGENVSVSGELHDVTLLRGSETAGWTVDLHSVLGFTTATGETSRATYLAYGADHGTAHYPPGPPVRAFFNLSFFLHPADPCFTAPGNPPGPCHPPVPIRALALQLKESFNADGAVAATSIQVGNGSK